MILESWEVQVPTNYSGQIALESGKPADIRLEYFEEGGGAEVHLWWSSPSTRREIVPTARSFAVPNWVKSR